MTASTDRTYAVGGKVQREVNDNVIHDKPVVWACYQFGNTRASAISDYLYLFGRGGMAKFCDRLKTARLASGLSQEKLGVEAGIHETDSARARINRYERGTRVPAFEVVEQIARVLNVPPTYLYAQDDDEAALLLAFHHLSTENRRHLLDVIMTLPSLNRTQSD
jgi:transcriptional regulator with XRE-family HTH domain